jgi:hypothetical protein
MLPFSHSILSRLTWPRSLFSQSKARISPFLVGSSRVTRPRSFLACSPRREENISVGLSRSPLAYHLPTSCRASRESCFKLSLLSDLLSTCAEATGVPIKTVAIVISRSHLFVFMSPSPRRTLTACTSPLLGRKAAGSVQLRSAVSPPIPISVFIKRQLLSPYTAASAAAYGSTSAPTGSTASTSAYTAASLT